VKAFLTAIIFVVLTIANTKAAQRASVFGRISSPVETASGESLIKTVPITTQRLLKEYGLSRRDYVLGYEEGSYVPLQFHPRRPGLPTIRVLEVSLDTVTRRVVQEANAANVERSMSEFPLFASEVIQPGRSPNFLTGFRGTGFEAAVFLDGFIRSTTARVIGSSDTYFFNFTIRAGSTEVPRGTGPQ
jgi:hypothetical protein